MEFSTAKILAIIGLILGLVGGGHAALATIGLVIYLIGMYGLAEHYGRRELFHYALYATIGMIIAIIAAAVIIGIGVLTGAFTHGFSIGAGVVAGFIVLYIGVLIAGKYNRDLMQALGEYGDKGLADLSAKLYWYGAILTIILVGLLLVFIAEILEIIVLATLREQAPATYQP